VRGRTRGCRHQLGGKGGAGCRWGAQRCSSWTEGGLEPAEDVEVPTIGKGESDRRLQGVLCGGVASSRIVRMETL
jgi:hypothetical protein